MLKKVLLVAAGLALLVGYMAYLTLSNGQISCEVCMEFRGQMECRKATGKDKAEAQTSATGTACSLLASGVADSIACQNAEPVSVSCEEVDGDTGN